MELKHLQNLVQEKSDILWLLQVREATHLKKLGLIRKKINNPNTGSSVLSIMTKYCAYSDGHLQEELYQLHSMIEIGIASIKIEDLKDILP